MKTIFAAFSKMVTFHEKKSSDDIIVTEVKTEKPRLPKLGKEKTSKKE